MPRFLAAKPDADLIRLPWSAPLDQWPAQYLVALPRGISRHVVRFLQVGDEILAAKEILEEVAVQEYRLLTELKHLGIPSVEPVGVVLGRVDINGDPLDPVLLTQHLPFSLPYRSLFYPGVKHETVGRLLDAMVVLFVRLHLSGFYWGDVSLSNILFRRDAGEFAAYLVDAETGEVHDQLTDGQRAHDLQIARTNLFGEFLDLEAGGILDPSLDPHWLVGTIEERYHQLWAELTGVEEFDESELYRLEGRVRR
ncbi:MAG TPA: lipopolysaccharide kinase InaA family protein, partial [Arachnia sp.]|nr:lipopolysaccharide kinase InaA family protein [Arachnia sp.]